jgi:hypothetical protein
LAANTVKALAATSPPNEAIHPIAKPTKQRLASLQRQPTKAVQRCAKPPMVNAPTALKQSEIPEQPKHWLATVMAKANLQRPTA